METIRDDTLRRYTDPFTQLKVKQERTNEKQLVGGKKDLFFLTEIGEATKLEILSSQG